MKPHDTFLELAAIAGGVTLAGLWIERKIEQLGAVIMGAGLALCFFTAFAARFEQWNWKSMAAHKPFSSSWLP